MKSFASTLAAIGKPLTDDELISHILCGLGSDWSSFVTSMSTRAGDLTLDEFYGFFIDQEARDEQEHSASEVGHASSSANFANRNNNQNKKTSFKGNQNQPHYDSGNRNFQGGNHESPDFCGGPRFNNNNCNSGSPEPCQICGKKGHKAPRCWYRMDQSYQGAPRSAAVASTPSYKIDTDWYADTGATDHITSDLDCLAVRERYQGNDKVQVGNGQGLHIAHIGKSFINTTTKPLLLNNVLHVPDITKNLLSIHKFTCDNDVSVTVYPYQFVVQDLLSQTKVLEGRCRDGLYPLKPSLVASSSQALTATKDQWHAHL